MTDTTFQVTRDFIGLSTETKPTTDVEDGSVWYEPDTTNSYVFYNGTWYAM